MAYEDGVFKKKQKTQPGQEVQRVFVSPGSQVCHRTVQTVTINLTTGISASGISAYIIYSCNSI